MKEVKFSQGVIDDINLIVDKCMGEEEAYCVSECPMTTDAKGYVNLIAENDLEGAIKLIRDKLFLPNTLGRICAHPCEKACRRNTEFNEPIAIAALKRYAAEKADRKEDWDTTVKADSGKHVVIIGAGPAGAQAAIDLRREGHQVTILEKLDVVGGMMRVGIPEYRLPRDVIDFEYSYLTDLGVEFKFGVEVGKDVMFADLQKEYDAVIIAHGAHKGNLIPLHGHEAEGVFTAVDYLKEISLTKAFPKAGKRVAVIGGGDVAMDCARSSFRIGSTEVYQCSLEKMEDLPASQEEIDESLEENVQFNAGWGPLEILKDEDGKVKGLMIQEVSSVLDSEGNFDPIYVGEPKVLDVDTVIFATGQLVVDIADGALEQTRGGRYVVDKDTLATSVENVFVVGDAAGTNIVIEAMAYGRKAALSINNLFNGKELSFERNFETEYSYVTQLDIPLPEGTEDLPRVHHNLRNADERKLDFEQCDLGLTDEQAVKEASRCLECECKICMQECVMMNDYGSCPKEILDEIAKGGEMDPLLAYSCNSCDNCTIVCPHELPMKKIFIASRKDFVKANNGESPIAGHKAIKMHQLFGFSKLFSIKRKGRK